MSGQWPPEWEDSDTGLPDEWTDDDAGLDLEASEVALFLASVPSPVLPASFEARISAAIAAEATARANGTASAGTASAGGEAAGTASAGTEAGARESASAGIAAAETDDAKTTDRSSPPEFSPAAAETDPATATKHRRRRASARSRSTSTAPRGTARRSGLAGAGPDGRRRRFRLPSAAVTGPLVILLVIAGFALVFTQLGGSSSSSSSAVASSGLSGTAAPAGTSANSPFAGPIHDGSVPQYETRRPGGSGLNAKFLVTESGTEYQGATLASQVREQLNALSPRAVTPAPSLPNGSSASAAASASATSPPTAAPSANLAGCVSHLTGGVTPSLVDQASYDGTPAYIIAVPSRVWVVRLGCTAADPQEITSVSLTGLFRESQRPRIG